MSDGGQPGASIGRLALRSLETGDTVKSSFRCLGQGRQLCVGVSKAAEVVEGLGKTK